MIEKNVFELDFIHGNLLLNNPKKNNTLQYLSYRKLSGMYFYGVLQNFIYYY